MCVHVGGGGVHVCLSWTSRYTCVCGWVEGVSMCACPGRLGIHVCVGGWRGCLSVTSLPV